MRKKAGETDLSVSGPKVLSEIEILKDLSPEELFEVESHCRYKTFSADEQIFDRHGVAKDVFFVVRGKVRVVNYSLSGREVTLNDVAQGGIFGELAAIDGQPRSASVMALTDCLIVAMRPQDFVNALKKYPAMAMSVMNSMTNIIRVSTERIMDLSTLGAHNRVHADLLRLALSNKTGENTSEIRPIPVHGDIASRVSTTRETVSRVMNELARMKILERKKDVLLIHDLHLLQDMVEEVRGE
ncbi:MAG: Crp/Fnr family transcriptional regulator [Rhodospirillales bacterium]